ncbi:MAG: biopolymer transporter ExbD [Bacteroidales bacterium]|nr:biopolymer transporter ExbD [Bacteroidales bacterium]MCB8998486.1 biopolymer transporter ExbD [Bacteroidales bacterium]MCB9012927.1 biopolymer transporter ExbD [Bacteroidales bacterium]
MRIKTRNKITVAFSTSGMTDIVFLLLLFFMITSTMIAPNALKLLLPQQGQTSSLSQDEVPEVELQGSGNISIDGKKVSIDELSAILTRKLNGQNDPTFKLITANDVTVKETVGVMNVAVKNNYKVVLIKQ